MLTLTAHSQDLHVESTSQIEHLLTNSFVAVSVFGLVIAIIVFAGRQLFDWKLPQTILAILAVCFVAGVLGYSFVPILSVIALSLGIFLALGLVVLSLA